jgi:hypothetical protein
MFKLSSQTLIAKQSAAMSGHQNRDNRINMTSRSRGDMAPLDQPLSRKHPRVVESDSESPPSESQNGHAEGNQPGARDLIRNAGIDLLGAVPVNVSLQSIIIFF